MTTTSLPTASPAASGVDPAGIHALVDALEASPQIEPHGLMVLRGGQLLAAGWWTPYAAHRPHLLYSLSKSFTSLAAGIAVDEGLLDPERTVLSYFPELDAEVTDERSRRILVRHVAAMASGHTGETLDGALAIDFLEPVRGFLLTPPEEEPGSVFAYNQPCTYALGAIVQRESGQTLTEYLRPRLLDPLGIGEVGWQQHPPGRDFGFSGLHATTDAVARLGQLMLQRGEWEGRQLVPLEWVDAATREQVSTAGEGAPDSAQGYGYQFWMSRHGYRGDGAYGQFAIVVPELELVVALTTQSTDGQAVLDAVWSTLLPAVGEAREPDPIAEGELAARLAGLALEPRPRDAEPGDAIGLLPATGEGAEIQTTVTGAAVRVDGVRRILELHEGERVHELELGDGAWAVTEEPVPVAGSASWDAAGGLVADLAFLETPHRLRVALDPAAGTAEARWVTVPLRSSVLDELRMPRPGVPQVWPTKV
ncbi:serine hydrolase domain-containing protein [Homoserinibacter sp. YIM 151385]|uniref:serine hydrolase domain-containing protein n=1 Tax=Homoserinibacter sp. YIM 151385 TaxID=2985506 RepID=UPI0022F08FD9|nr:serine hydrolase [Homoserinibacter sp. YIM 151385]WBU37136.1 serine hydrolase [Homoserinibacter sp. YIM 151385]